jgi:MFS family permease
MYIVALGVYAYVHGGAVWVGVVQVARSVCSAVFSPFAGVVADRYPRRVVMIGSDVGRVVLLLAGALVVVESWPLWLLAVVAGGVSIAGAPYPSAMFALLPQLVDEPATLSAANAATSTVFAAAGLVGPAVGAALLSLSGVATVFVVSAAGALWSAVVILATPISEQAREQTPGRSSMLHDVAAGFGLVRHDRRLQLLLVVVGAITFLFGASNVLIVAIAFSVLHTGQSGASLLFAANGVGAVIGAVLAASLAAARPGLVLAAATAAMGATFAMAATSIPLIAAVMLALMGLASSIGDVADTTLGQRVAPGDLLGRYLGIAFAVIFTGTALGSLAAPALIHLTSVRTATILVGVLLIAVALAAWRSLIRVDEQGTPHQDIAAVLRRDPIFALLPQAIIQQLADTATHETHPTGHTLIHQGDAGDRYYLIDTGKVQATADGHTTTILGPGEGFGEIALLHDTPRTATITTLQPTTLISLARDAFLTALAQNTTSRLTAHHIAATRLTH